MSFRFDPDEPLPHGIRRIARERVDRVLDRLRDPGDDPDDAIHDARKRLKEVRGVLRLVRVEIGEEVFDRENVAYRDAGRHLSDARESNVFSSTLDAVTEAFPHVLDPDPVGELRERLEARHREILGATLEEGGGLDRARALVEEARERIESWPVGDRGWAAFHGGLRKTYKRGRNRRSEAYGGGSPETFHQWRKRTKYLWYHVQILAPAWPEILDPLAEEIHSVSDFLGDANDFTDLRRLLEREPELVPAEGLARVIRALAGERRRELWEEARTLGLQVWAEEPEDFAGRVGSYWVATRPDDGPVDSR
jgi:CHAD domain-containing protein